MAVHTFVRLAPAPVLAPVHAHALALALGLVLTAAAGSACTSERSADSAAETGKGAASDPSGKDKKPDEAVPVEVATLETGDMEGVLRFSANLEAEAAVQVVARTSGLARSVLVEEGDEVKQGQVLLRIEDQEQQSQFRRVKLDLAKADKELALQKQLRERGLTSDQALDTATYEQSRLKLMLEDAGRALRYTVVTSPIAGTVTQRLVKQGSHVTPPQPLFAITDFHSLVARVFVPEKEMARLSVGQSARILATATGGAAHAGTVLRIAPEVDPRSGTVKVTIAVPKDAGLAPGMFVEVELVVESHANAVLLPKRALVYDNDIAYAFKVKDDMRVERVRVEPVLQSRDVIEPKSGFAAGDKVVIAGQVGLKDGALVAPQAAPSKAAGEGAPAKEAAQDTKKDEPKDTAKDAQGSPGEAK